MGIPKYSNGFSGLSSTHIINLYLNHFKYTAATCLQPYVETIVYFRTFVNSVKILTLEDFFQCLVLWIAARQ